MCVGWVSFWCLVFCFVCFTWIFSPHILCSILVEGRYTKSQPLQNQWVSWTNVVQLRVLLIQGKSNQPGLLHFRVLGWCQSSTIQQWKLGQVPPRHPPEQVKQPQIFRKGTSPPFSLRGCPLGTCIFMLLKILESLQFKGAKFKAPACPACLDYCHLAQLAVHSLTFPVTKWC